MARSGIVCRGIVRRSIVYRRAEGDGWAKSKIRVQDDDWAEGELRAGGTNKLAFTGNHAGRRFATSRVSRRQP
jgi:hypothetical protein